LRFINNKNVKDMIKMENLFLIAGIIAAVYFLVKFIEMRFVLKESRPLKSQLRDSLLVYVSSVLALFIYDNVSDISSKPLAQADVQVFTGNPGF
jgi:hypothetical protein